MIAFIFALLSFSMTYEFIAPPEERKESELVWEVENTPAFDELIVSWNGFRPRVGKWTLYVSLWQEAWSPWLNYAEWGTKGQKTFESVREGSFAHTFQDGAYLKKGNGSAFRVKIVAEEGADLNELDSLYACASNLSQYKIATPPPLPSVRLPNLFLQSQMVLDHPRNHDFCSPTSTSTAINCLLGKKTIDAIAFASRTHDDEFDICGNWILNTAEVYPILHKTHRCHVERLSGFEALHSHLTNGCPVVVSVKGPIPGAPEAYDSGHLICIVGYDASTHKVLCIDPAFPQTESTLTTYALTDFLAAWSRRRNIAYIFSKIR